MHNWGYTPATPFQLTPSFCCMPGYQGCYFAQFNSQHHLPNYNQAADHRGRQQQGGDGARSGITQTENMGGQGSQRAVALSKRCLGDAFASGPHGAPNSAGTETSCHRQKQHLQLPAKFPLAHLIANWGKKNTTYPSFVERLPVLE